jgi:hypothetical protein
MKRRAGFCLLFWLLPLLLAAAAASPTEKMFHGQVTTLEASGLALPERSAAVCRSWAAEKAGSVFFTAWAFPACEPIRSCRESAGDHQNGPAAVRVRGGRISVHQDGGEGLNISDGPGEKKDPVSWGVLLFLHQVKNNSCQVVDLDVLAPDRTYDLGGERLVWLGSATEAQGLELLRALPAREAGRDLHKELVFALYLFHGPAAVSELVALARRDPDMDVRKDAIFWLGQKASEAALAALGDVIASPEALEIKKAAVFALSQLPEEKGTPMLLRIARQNPQPRLRKEAIFWLGQSGDPRALDFFEEILLK